MLRKWLFYTPLEVLQCLFLAALFTTPVWVGALLDRI